MAKTTLVNSLDAAEVATLQDFECQFHVVPEVFTDYAKKGGKGEALRCCLTGRSFFVPYGGIHYSLRALGDPHVIDPADLSPYAVSRGADYIQDKLWERAADERDSLRYRLIKLERMERGAKQDIIFDRPSGDDG